LNQLATNNGGKASAREDRVTNHSLDDEEKGNKACARARTMTKHQLEKIGRQSIRQTTTTAT
jgi:hypothetical protein